MKRLAGIVAAVAGILTLAVAPAANAAPADSPNGKKVVSIAGLKLIPANLGSANRSGDVSAQADAYLIPSGLNSNKCWDADLNSINRNGTKMQLWDCNDTAAHQAFYITSNPEGYFRFQNVPAAATSTPT